MVELFVDLIFVRAISLIVSVAIPSASGKSNAGVSAAPCLLGAAAQPDAQ
jgi:low temperature requirement protein LtrA